ncbi:MAG: VirB3 family type IV secretion system protein [Treponema sp.]|uniref:VirB3 family type IV secretion system protein n=1 Tax=Treponema sp. TaxID=166 RepID=UPI00298D96FD|nr:VirB3 family type IV secretion system protein [Treponema sp.]MCQ2596551.1 VirB3 family type IV secretion system protein [Treponema sp.]MCQ2601096.1 VirB3 family type IV secretion system protein [Treponema sp.]
MKDENIADYSIPVHQSLMEKKVLFGIGEKAFYTILICTIILASLVSIYCIGIGIAALLICRRVCKNEQMLLEFLFENFNQQDKYIG